MAPSLQVPRLDTSDRALANAPRTTPMPTSPNSPRSPGPTSPRSSRRARTITDLDGEEAEREFAEYGGDMPERMLVRRSTKNAERRRSVSGGSGFPDLHLVDSAFSEAHRMRSRAHSVITNPTTGVETVVVDPGFDPNRIQWDDNDPENPQNWSYSYKWAVTLLCSFLTVNVTFASSAPSSATLAIADAFATSEEVSLLVTSMFLFGYCLGPLLWSSLSELFGRRIIFITTMFAYMLCQIGPALASNVTTVIIFRFLAGTFAASPLTNCGGVIADTWDAVGRGPAVSIFTAAVFLGPVIGPIVGGYVTDSYLGWRWIFWVMMIWAALSWVLVVAFLPETYAPVLLAKRARRLRKTQPEKHSECYAELERADFSLKSIITRTMTRPFSMLATEPILMLVTLYLSVVYGLLYGLFSVFPIIWSEVRGFSNGKTGLVFIAVGLGTTAGATINILVQRHYKVLVPKWHGHPPPEERLWGSIIAGPFLIIGIFMLGWTGQFVSIPWWVPAIAAIFLGASFTLVFISFQSYLIEVYLMYSASALAANTIVRSAVGAATPLFINQMYGRLGIGGASSVIGGIAILISPSPIIFYLYGSRFRADSQYAPGLDIHMREQVEREEREEKEQAETAMTGEVKVAPAQV